MGDDYSFGDMQEGTLAYDLRQRYAKLVGDNLDRVAYHRVMNDYPNWFKALEDLYTIVAHKIKCETGDGKKGEDELLNKTYEELRQELIEVSNDNHDAWQGKSKDADAVAKVEEALRKIERMLYLKMDKASMFGTASFYDEDEI